MNIFKTALLATAALAASALPSFAQDAMPGHDMSAMGGDSTMASPLPEICLSAGDMGGDMSMDMQGDMDQAHMDLMAGMDETNKQMMSAMMVEDIDALHAVIRARGLRIVKGLRDKDYGLRAFVFEDPDGNRIDVGEPMKT